MIKFWGYKSNPEYFFMSNFYRASFIYDNKEYKTSEHFYQAMKFYPNDMMPNEFCTIQDHIRNQKTPKEAALEGRRTDLPIRPDWEEIKLSVMKCAVYCKFIQNEELKYKLLATGDEILIEDSPYDYIWGIGKDGSGTNWLGIILMQVRKGLRRNENVVN